MKSKFEYLIFGFGILCLMGAMGNYLPVRQWLYDYIPFMTYSRFPALFRLYSIICFIILAGYGIKRFTDNFLLEKKKMFVILTSISVIYMVFLIQSILKISDFTFIKSFDLFDKHKISSFDEHVFLQCLIQLFFISIFYLLIYTQKSIKVIRKTLLFLVTIEMLLAVQMNINYTVLESKARPILIQNGLNTMPKGFPVPKRKNMLHTENERIGVWPIWRNVNVFSKEPSVDAFSSFWLKNNELFMYSTNLANATLSNPIAFLSDKVFSYNDFDNRDTSIAIHPKTLYFNEYVYKEVTAKDLKNIPVDTAIITSFGPNKITIKTKTLNPQILTLQQSNYPGWAVKINNEDAKLYTSNFLFMSTIVPQGENVVTFMYVNTPVKIAFYVSIIVIFLLLISLVIKNLFLILF